MLPKKTAPITPSPNRRGTAILARITQPIEDIQTHHQRLDPRPEFCVWNDVTSQKSKRIKNDRPAVQGKDGLFRRSLEAINCMAASGDSSPTGRKESLSPLPIIYSRQGFWQPCGKRLAKALSRQPSTFSS